MIEICGGDDDFARELAGSFLESAPRCLAGIEQPCETATPSWPRRPMASKGSAGRSAPTSWPTPATISRTRRAARRPRKPRRRGRRRVDGAWEGVRAALEDYLVVEIENMKILIAEDQPTAALYLRRTLEKMGHEADVAPDGEEAWRIVAERRCASLDLRLDDAATSTARSSAGASGPQPPTATPTSSC